MKPYKSFLFVLFMMFLIGSVSAISQTHDHKKVTVSQKKETYTCPMHPEVVSDKEGKCPKCGMNLVKKTSENQPDEKTSTASSNIKQAKQLLKDAKNELTQEGKYACCLKDPCNTCLLTHQSCDCHKDLKAGEPVCNECYAGWQRGEGADKSIKLPKVKTSYKKHDH